MRAAVKCYEWDAIASDDEPATLVMHVGPIDAPGEDLFTVSVCTPEALAKLIDRDGALIGRHFLFVSHIDRARIESFVDDRLRRIDGETWSDLAGKIGRIGRWEFEP